jgi:hypothetical protein
MESLGPKLFVLISFLLLFAFALRRDRVYIVPFILLFYSNINGLLGWEDFALKGFIKFQDYGLMITLFLLGLHILHQSFDRHEPDYVKVARRTVLYNAINFFWINYLVLFAFAVVLQGAVWPIKMGRTFFYGLVIYVAYREIMVDPLAKLERLFRFMMWLTLFFGSLYIFYNLSGFEIYPKGEHEVFKTGHLNEEDVRRNFSGFPTFAHFFLFYFVDRILRNEGSRLFNVAGASILAACVMLVLTRYTLVITLAITLFLILYRKQDIRTVGRLAAAAVAFAVLLPLIGFFTETYYTALLSRFDEFSGSGVLGSSSAQVRLTEFKQIFSNVMDFNPFFGFGFTVPWGFGYKTNVYHAGSADNGYANILGISGFLGLMLFFVLIGSWIIVNRRLRALEAENLSRVTFAFIFFVLAGMMNDAHASYMHYFGIFMVYDLFAYAYLKHQLIRKPIPEQRQGAETAPMQTGESRSVA